MSESKRRLQAENDALLKHGLDTLSGLTAKVVALEAKYIRVRDALRTVLESAKGCVSDKEILDEAEKILKEVDG